MKQIKPDQVKGFCDGVVTLPDKRTQLATAEHKLKTQANGKAAFRAAP